MLSAFAEVIIALHPQRAFRPKHTGLPIKNEAMRLQCSIVRRLTFRQAPVVGTFRRAGPAAAVLSKVADLTQHTAAFLQAFCGLLLVSLIIGPLVFHWCSLKLAIPLN